MEGVDLYVSIETVLHWTLPAESIEQQMLRDQASLELAVIAYKLNSGVRAMLLDLTQRT